MNIFTNVGDRLSLSDLEKIQSDANIKLPDDLIRFLLDTNGGIPEKNTWLSKDGNEPIIVSCLLPIISQEDSSIVGSYTAGIAKGYLPNDLLPFARDWGGNFICIDPQGKIFFYATDSWHNNIDIKDNIIRNKKYLCKSLSVFLNNLVSESEAY